VYSVLEVDKRSEWSLQPKLPFLALLPFPPLFHCQIKSQLERGQPSLLFPVPILPFPLPFLPLEVGSSNPARGSRGAL